MARYSSTSPYFVTDQNNNNLEILKPNEITELEKLENQKKLRVLL